MSNQFFETLRSILPKTDVSFKFVITRNLESLSITLIPHVKEGVPYDLPAFTAKGTAEDLDANFLTAFSKVMESNKEFIDNSVEFSKQLSELNASKSKEIASAKKSTGKGTSKATPDTDDSDDDGEGEDQKATETKTEKVGKVKTEKPAKATAPKKLTAALEKTLKDAEAYEKVENWDLAVFSYVGLYKSLMKDSVGYESNIKELQAKIEEIGPKSPNFYDPSQFNFGTSTPSVETKQTETPVVVEAPATELFEVTKPTEPAPTEPPVMETPIDRTQYPSKLESAEPVVSTPAANAAFEMY